MHTRMCLECENYLGDFGRNATICGKCTKLLDRLNREKQIKQNRKCGCGAHAAYGPQCCTHSHWCDLYEG